MIIIFNFYESSVILDNIIKQGADKQLTDKQFIIKEINHFKMSPKRKEMIIGCKYYKGEQDILKNNRTMIGKDGKPEEVTNLPNEHIVDNQYRKMVKQKTNYLFGKPFSLHSDNAQYVKLLQNNYFKKSFNQLLLRLATDFLNCGLAWVYVFYDEQGNLSFKRIKPYEIIPGWKDSDHTELEYAIHIYSMIEYVGNDEEKVVDFVEVFDDTGITYFQYTDSGDLTPREPYHSNYFSVQTDNDAVNYNWSKIPLICFKYNDEEIPLIKSVKSLQDGINIIESNFLNCMEEDVRNTILVIVNYDGTDLAEFRRNLATYGAVKVRTTDGAGGDVKTLSVEVNAENYKAILDIFKKAIIENAMGYDAKDDRLSGNPNEMNIQSMYSDIDLDANGIETLTQSAFEELLWFINSDIYNKGLGDYENEIVDFIFDRDMLINESTVIDNCTKSVGILSDETIVANHPWIDNPQLELERIKKQKEDNIEQYQNAFVQSDNKNDDVNGDNQNDTGDDE